MANRDLEINVKYRPDDDTLSTEQTGASPVSGNLARNANIAKGFIGFTVAFSSISRIVSTSVGQIGEVTGNRPLQRKIENFSRLAGYAAFAAINPVFAAASIGTELAAETIQRQVKMRNEQIELEFYKNLYGSKYNNSRR
jgi:hypothetical protein